jgi:hypothetical protein
MRKFSAYYFDIDYDRTSCNGNCDDYCRCNCLINIKINSIENYESLLNDILKSTGLTYPKQDQEFYLYAIERFGKFIGLDNPDSYEASACRGYYGEELNGTVELDYELSRKLDEFVANVLSTHNKTLIINDLLTREYGYVLDSLKTVKNWEIREVNYKDILFPNKNRFEYTTRVDSKLVATYREFDLDLPKGLAVFENNKYRVIDGYHRLIASDTKDKVKLLVAVF